MHRKCSVIRELVRLQPQAAGLYKRRSRAREWLSEQGRHKPSASPMSDVGRALPPTTQEVAFLEVAKVKGMVKCRKVGMIRYSPERPVHL